MVDVILSVIFAAWFGRAARHAGRNVLPWAAGGAALFFGLNQLLIFAAFAIANWADVQGFGDAALLLVSVWIVSIVATTVIGVRILPLASSDRLRMEIAIQEARASESGSESPEEGLLCDRCGRIVMKRDALVQGALRLDDSTCICADCKGTK